MKSKPIFKTVLVIISFSLFIGCSSEGEENPLEQLNVSRDFVIGTWTWEQNNPEGLHIEFEEDGTGEFPFYDYDVSNDVIYRPLEWRLDLNVLTIEYFANIGTSTFEIIEIDEKSMLLQDEDGSRRDYSKM